MLYIEKRVVQIVQPRQPIWFPNVPAAFDNVLLPRPREGVARYCFDPVCLCVCVSGQYFISRLLDDISI